MRILIIIIYFILHILGVCHAENLYFTTRKGVYLHDPSAVHEINGYLTVYASGEDGNGLLFKYVKPGKKQWSSGLPVFPQGDKPEWTKEIQIWNPTGEFDAPDLPRSDIMYYTVFDETEEQIQDAIGRAVAVGDNLLTWKWEDDGVVLRSKGEGKHPRAMDPCVFEDFEENTWMVFGSYAGGIYITQLDTQTGKLLQHPEDVWCSSDETDYPDRFIHLADYGGDLDENAIEAPYIYKHDGYYYLFVNWDQMGQGAQSTYNIRVGRSESPTGPYLDKTGRDMANGGGTLFLEGKRRFLAPGHAAIFEYLKKGKSNYIFTFHYYDKKNECKPTLGARKLTWKKGWPKLRNNIRCKKIGNID